MLTFVSAVEFDIKREQTLSSILDMSKANVKIIFSEKKSLMCNEDKVMPVGGREQD